MADTSEATSATQPADAAQDQTTQMLSQLEQARRLTLADTGNFTQVVPGILGIVGPSAVLPIRRWGAEFLADSLAYPSLPAEQRQSLALTVLPTIQEYLDQDDQDPYVVASAIRTACTIYPLIFKHVINNPAQTSTWQQLVAIKSGILRGWDDAPSDIRPMCIKFVVQVILVQTPGLIASADPRRADQNDISISLVPSDHPLIQSANMQAEAHGLLDRLLDVFSDESIETVYLGATLNCIGVLVFSRPSVEAKIMNRVLNIDPFAAANYPMDTKMRIDVRSKLGTVRAFLLHYNKRKQSSNNPFAGRIQSYLDRVVRTQKEIFESNGIKRPVGQSSSATPAAEAADRVTRQGQGSQPLSESTPTASSRAVAQGGPVPLAQIFTLTDNEVYKNFNVGSVTWVQALQVVITALSSVDQTRVDNAVNSARHRLLEAKSGGTAPPIGSSFGNPPSAPTVEDDDDEEYTPEDVKQQPSNQQPAPEEDPAAAGVDEEPFVMQQPPPMTYQEAVDAGCAMVDRMFERLPRLPDDDKVPRKFTDKELYIDDKRGWLTFITRMATRADPGPVPWGETEPVRDEEGLPIKNPIVEYIRERLYNYVMEDFRTRIPFGLDWIVAEFFGDADKKRLKNTPETSWDTPMWIPVMLRLLDGILPYLDGTKDRKLFVRFLSEVPTALPSVLERVKKLAKDPECVFMAINGLHYLILWSPPVKENCLDVLVDFYQNYPEAKALAEDLLKKFRPEALGLEPLKQEEEDE